MDPIHPQLIAQINVNRQVQQNQGAQKAAHVNEVQGQHNIDQADEAAKMMLRKK